MSCVYFARNRTTGLTKIGTSCYLPDRLRSLSRSVGAPIDLLATTPGDYHLEQGLHGLLIDLHEGGEWFRPDPRLDALVIGVREGWIDTAKFTSRQSAIRSEIALRSWERRRAAALAEAA